MLYMQHKETDVFLPGWFMSKREGRCHMHPTRGCSKASMECEATLAATAEPQTKKGVAVLLGVIVPNYCEKR